MTISSISVTNSSAISVVTVGTQGLSGPNTILGRSVADSTASTAGSLLIYDHANTQWEDSQSTRSQSLTAKLYNLQFTSGGATVTQIFDEDDMSSNSSTGLVTQQSIKAYVDAQLTAQDLDFQGDSGGALSIDLDSETLDIAGGTGIDTVGSGNTLTVSIDSTVATLSGTQTLTNKTLTSPKINDTNAITATGAEINIIDGDTSESAVVIVDADKFIINDSGSMKQLAASRISTYVSGTTETLTNKTISADNNTLSNIEVDNFKASAIVLESEGIGSNDNDTTLPTSAAVKDYVDTQITAEDLDLTSDSGTIAIDLDSETLTVSGGEGIDTSATGNTLTITAEEATDSNKGVASFDSTDFTVSSGAVTLNAERVQDIIGAMVSSNTENGISVTYEDSDGTLDFDVADPTITLSGDVAGSATMTNLGNVTISTTIQANSIALGTDTTGNFVADISAGEGIDVSGGGSENATITVSAEDATSSNKGIASFDSTDFTVSSGAVTVNAERVQDIVGAMFSSNTESGISVSYEDSDGTIDLNVADPVITLSGDVAGSATMTDLGDVTISTTIQANSVALGTDTTGNFVQAISGTSNEIEVSGSGSESATVTIGLPNDVTIGNNLIVTGNLTVSGSTTTLNTATLDVEDQNITLNKGDGDTSGSADGAGITIQDAVNSSTDATISWSASNDNFVFSHEIVAPSLDISGNVDIDGTLETDALTINGTASVPFESADHTKLDGIEANATADQTASEIRTLVESASDSNVFTDADHTKLNGIEASATADQTDSEIKTAYENNSDTNAFTDALLSKLNAIEAGATADQTSEEIQDIAGAMFSSNTETGITATYQDADGTIDLVLDADQTSLTSIVNSSLEIGRDADNRIKFGTDNQIIFEVSGGDNVIFKASGEIEASSLDISGDVDIDGTLEADAITVNGTTLAETIADTVGAMVSSNTETGITVSFDDSDNTLDFVIGTLNQDTTGTAALATEVTVSANNSTDETIFPVFVDGATGSQGLETDTGFTYNPSTGLLSSAGVTASGTMTFGSLSDGTITVTAFVDEDNMASNSASLIPTQQSVKAYVDSEISSAGGMSQFIIEDDDGTEVTINNNKEIKFIGSGLTTNFTDTSDGSDSDPFDLTFTIDSAQTGITSILATDLKIGEDDQTKIDFETADEIHFYAANAEQVFVSDGVFGPQTDSDVDLGTSSVRFKDAYVDSITVTGEVDGASLDISGNADIDGTLEADAITVNGTALDEFIQDTVGAMVGSNTETGISVTYQDSDGTLDFVIGTLNQDTTGNAATATALETARNIHGVSFDGTANIDLSEVIQDTVGAMVGSNTETGIAVTYEDSDGTLDFVISSAQTAISSLLNASLVIGRDADNDIDFGTDNNMIFRVNAEDQIVLKDGVLEPVTDDNVDLGSSSKQFKDGFFDGTLEADAITVDGVALDEFIQDTVGAMVSSNTESGISVTYQDSDGTLDFSVSGGTSDNISDADGDTKIQVEESSDEDVIRFDTAGSERLNIDGSGNITHAGGRTKLGGTLANTGVLAVLTGSSGGVNGAVSTQSNGSIIFANTDSSSVVPAIMMKGDGGRTQVRAATANGSTYDMEFNVRENDDSDFADVGGKGFLFSRHGTELIQITRHGNVDIGFSSGVGAGDGNPALRVTQSSTSFNGNLLQLQAKRSSSSAFSLIQAYANFASDPKFKVRGDGEVTADGSFSGGGADYAEFFEWNDGNSSNEDRVGYSVSLVNGKIKIAESGETVIGVISGNPSVVGDAQELYWQGKYEKDDYGRDVYEDYTQTEWVESKDNGTDTPENIKHSYQTDKIPSGISVPSDATVVSVDENGNNLRRRKRNSSYDESLTYVPRSERKEWACVGLMGKVRLRSGQQTAGSWIKLKDITSDVEEWLIK